MKKKFTAIILAMLMLSGCGSVDEDIEDNTNQPPEELNMTDYNTFDFDRISDNIYYNNDKLELLSSIKDWNSAYKLEFTSESEVDGQKIDMADLYNGEKKIGSVLLNKDSSDINDEYIYSITFGNTYEGYTNAKIDDFKIGTDYLDIINRYGEPEEIQSFDEDKIYYYRKDSGHFVMINLDKDNKVSGISVCCNNYK